MPFILAKVVAIIADVGSQFALQLSSLSLVEESHFLLLFVKLAIIYLLVLDLGNIKH